jgi:hypothetical protein
VASGFAADSAVRLASPLDSDISSGYAAVASTTVDQDPVAAVPQDILTQYGEASLTALSAAKPQ